MNRFCAGIFALCLIASSVTFAANATENPSEIQPRVYAAWKCSTPPVIDGALDETIWSEVPWTAPFVDIEGSHHADGTPTEKPRFETRVAMCWDSSNFYIAARMEEPHLWATYDQRDMVIFHENDFEVFIDPLGDSWNYYELEINALNTVWDLMLTKPYRYDGKAIDGWDITGLQSAVHLDGTLNNPDDVDKGWTVEIAIPWEALTEADVIEGAPLPGDLWRVNFSRVQWHTEEISGRYAKQTDTTTGNPLSEDNWVWSPQGKIAMHLPEMWGGVLFVNQEQQTDTGINAQLEKQKTKLAISVKMYHLLQHALSKAVTLHESTGHYPDSELGGPWFVASFQHHFL